MSEFIFFILFFLQLALAFLLGQMVEMQRSRRHYNILKDLNDEIHKIAISYRDGWIAERRKREELEQVKPAFKSKPLKKK